MSEQTQTPPDVEAWTDRIRSIPNFPQPGVDFKDITPLLADGPAFGEVVDAIAGLYADRVDKVCGIEARGFILAAPVAYRLGVGFVPIRKHGKLPYTAEAASYELEYSEAVIEIHCDALKAGERVLIVDDVLATGGTARAAADLVERLGGNVVGLVCLIELEFLNGRSKLDGLELQTFIRY
ncbi:MAG TPA: adenine phosphoribosyltransferase [Actinomycetota bacterium]|nr:adenine phosphoribosyltransferase [Actinomycetota bacterium]